jgi:hypothetical protein
MFRRRSVRLLLLGLAGALAVYVARVLRGDPAPVFSGTSSAPPPDTGPIEVPAPEAVASIVPPLSSAPPWVDADGTSPTTHPVKGKLKSGIYHLPGMLNYDRTVPDRWYRDAEAAESDGLRIAKR